MWGAGSWLLTSSDVLLHTESSGVKLFSIRQDKRTETWRKRKREKDRAWRDRRPIGKQSARQTETVQTSSVCVWDELNVSSSCTPSALIAEVDGHQTLFLLHLWTRMQVKTVGCPAICDVRGFTHKSIGKTYTLEANKFQTQKARCDVTQLCGAGLELFCAASTDHSWRPSPTRDKLRR